MQAVAGLSVKERAEIFTETAANRNMTPSIVDKDFWVTWVLKCLFEHSYLSTLLTFKGGTSLSKAYQLIERFSEDIDLVLDWNVLHGENPVAHRSNSKQALLNAKINMKTAAYIADELLPIISSAAGNDCVCTVDVDDPFIVNMTYPAAFADRYLRPEVRLEIGPLASWAPSERRPVRSYAAEVFPGLFKSPECVVRVICAERTFWEKVTILHHEAHRPHNSLQPIRYSRHYYDVARMALSDLKQSALAQMSLLEQVVEFKQRFYPRRWARYDLAKPGSLVLMPTGNVLNAVKTDYGAMREMIFGDVPTFESINATLKSLEADINAIT